MSQYEQQSLTARHSNNGLFSDYYLNEIVPTLPEWNEILFSASRQVLAEIRALRSHIQPARLDEAQLEEQWIQPVLRILGHHYTVQVKIRYRETGHRKPDYVFLNSVEAAHALTSAVYPPQEIAHALALGDAKRWGAKLDQSTSEARNPSQQIDEYLRYSELDWGILTDGRTWRLYHRDSSKNNFYYAVDLEALLEAGETESFLYFYAFFRREAFSTGWLAKVLAGSADFAQKLTDKLEDEVYDALEMIAQGFLDYRRNRLEGNPAMLKVIYTESLVLLYRLLFIFYAESREILPLNDNAEYTSRRSLQAIKRGVATALDYRQPLNPDSGEVYNRLRDLFFAVDAGDERLDLPPYNGRLFSDSEHPFLRDYVVGDAALIPALDKLARVDDNGRRVYVDYRDLEVRHLGSIYEKLLEYDLDIASQPLTTTGREQRYAPAAGGAVVVKQPGQVYLRTGSNERKITGSYYTPDYIVRFIVEKTLEPLLSEIMARHANQDAEGNWHVDNAEALVGEVLALNILDPATGSGHFVVDVTQYIAERLRDLNLRPADLGDEDELIYWKRLVASACVYALDINPLAVELAKLSMWLTTLAKGKPLSFLDHHIRLGNSLVGTRITEIDDSAVSVREETRRRKALERQRQREAATGQMAIFSDTDFSAGVRFAVEQMHVIEHTVADDVRAVKRQEELYEALTRRLSAWQQAAHVWTARYFGLEVSAEDWKAIREFTAMRAVPPRLQAAVNEAERIAREHHFFHWELAFPEIFFDADGQPKGNPGFDAVVGNPPYVRQERIQPIKLYLQAYYDVYSGTADLFLYFYERGLKFLKRDHRLGFVTSGTYMNSNSAQPFRKYIHENAGIEWVANFGENQPFRGAEMVYPTIVVMRAGEPRETFRNLFVEGNVRYAELGSALESGEWVDSLSDATGMEEWRFQPAELTRLYQKLVDGYISLGDFVDHRIYRGVTTGLNEVFIINSETKNRLVHEHHTSSELIKPMLRGQDLRPWYQIDGGEYLIFTRSGVEISRYPAIQSYLEQYRQQLEPKPENWRGSWLGRKAGPYQWYEIQDQTAYYREFEQAKIWWADISKLPRFSWNEWGDYLNNTGFFISNASFSLLALLQSRVIWFVISQIATPLRLRAGLWQYRVLPQNVERLPIPGLTPQQESELAAIAEEITGLARARYQQHEDMRQTIRSEFDGGGISTRVALYRWWEFADEKALSDEIRRQFRQEIPLTKRSEWRRFLADQQAEHQRLTAQIVALETRMNAIVYDAFDLTPDERQLIEATTKYPYGEV
jgi:hypothetical protein